MSASQAQADFAGLCGTIHTPAIAEALERARVVGVLDAWAAGPAPESDRSWATRCAEEGRLWACHLVTHGGNRKWCGVTADSARAAAAKAIESGEV